MTFLKITQTIFFIPLLLIILLMCNLKFLGANPLNYKKTIVSAKQFRNFCFSQNKSFFQSLFIHSNAEG